eukprot:TRINITY_DN8268_c0_g1_i2.p1 TRINITY_DN8268_c0_g1~~TRINITY_DN8268_c0_g1_i2.p1  ORF type:complete len:179 (+),score=31.90 TRINITY_DN8268_c0_g1_i2:210-746(+)
MISGQDPTATQKEKKRLIWELEKCLERCDALEPRDEGERFLRKELVNRTLQIRKSAMGNTESTEGSPPTTTEQSPPPKKDFPTLLDEIERSVTRMEDSVDRFFQNSGQDPTATQKEKKRLIWELEKCLERCDALEPRDEGERFLRKELVNRTLQILKSLDLLEEPVQPTSTEAAAQLD